MIQVGTLLAISDNSGAKKAKCIKILKKTKKNMGQAGDLIVVSLQETNPKNNTKTLKKGQLFKAVLLETKRPKRRQDGTSYTFQRNSAALLSAQGSPLGTRVQGTAPFEVREKNFMKLLVLASTTL